MLHTGFRVRSTETDFIKTEDLARIAPRLERRIPFALVRRPRTGDKMDLVEGVYVYRRTMESPYVLRLWLPLYEYRHGFSVPPGYWDGLSRRRWMSKLWSQFGRKMYLKGISWVSALFRRGERTKPRKPRKLEDWEVADYLWEDLVKRGVIA